MESINQTSIKLLKKKAFILIIPIIIIILVSSFSSENKTINDILGSLIGLSVVFIFFFIFDIVNQAKKIFFQEFAKSINFEYQDHFNISQLEGSLFSNGNDRYISHILIGKIENKEVKIFSYLYSMGLGKYKRTYNFQIVEITTNFNLPNFVLKEKGFLNIFSSIDLKSKNLNQLKLEGDFNKYFDLEAEKEFEIEILQIFTPEFMLKLLENWSHLNIESIENKIYIYENKSINTRKELTQMFSLTKELISKISSIGEPLSKDVLHLRKKYF
jgi:hypothetical protein